MAVRIIKNESRLRHATLVSIDGIEFWTRPRIPNMPISSGDEEHTVEDKDRIDTIAKKWYKNEGYAWVIKHANNLMLLPSGLYVGQKLRIPNPRMVRRTLLV